MDIIEQAIIFAAKAHKDQQGNQPIFHILSIHLE